MKIFTTIDVTYKEGKRGEAVEALVELADVSKKNWPNAHFHVLSPRTGQHGRLIWIEQFPSMAAKEEYEESRFEIKEFAEPMEKIFALIHSSTVVDYHLIV